MKLTPEEVKLALKISKIIQKRIDVTGDTNLRSTDVFPYLVRKGLYPPDKHNGFYFRRFLNKLAKCGELHSLIPQCTRLNPVKDEIFSEWYFHNAKDKMPKPKVKPIPVVNENVSEPFEIEDAIDIVQMLIEGINPLTEEELNDNEIVVNPVIREALNMIINPSSYEIDDENKFSTDQIETLETEEEEEQEEQEENFNQTKAELNDYFEFNEDLLIEIKQEVSTWELKYPNKSDYWKNVRKNHKRAYEPWSIKEDEIIKLIWKNIRNEHIIGGVLLRSPNSILHRLIHLGLLEESEVNLK